MVQYDPLSCLPSSAEANRLRPAWHYDESGRRLPTHEELANQERQRADRLAKRLRELGVNPDNV
jgi:hypothetical protein